MLNILFDLIAYTTVIACVFILYINFKYEMRVREQSLESAWDDRIKERKSAEKIRQERMENDRRLSEERLEAERLAEEDKQRNRRVRADQLKDELVGQVAELK